MLIAQLARIHIFHCERDVTQPLMTQSGNHGDSSLNQFK